MENIDNKDAFKTFKELAENIDFALMSTNLSEFPLHTIPMSTKKVDSQGNIWFLSGKDSTHNKNIALDAKVHLSYAKPNNMEFLTVCGKAEIVNDQNTIEELYGKSDDMWFEGETDPNISALKIKPMEAHYWDTKDNKLVSLLKMGVAFITGNEPDTIETGDLKF